MTLILANLFGWIVANWRQALVIAVIGILLLSVAYWAMCGKSRLEKRIEERQPVIQEQQTGANQAINAAINANADARKAQEEANRIRNNPETNVSIDVANKNRCIAYPERCR